ncbi:hypothetical protein CRM22_000063 [Opisthorchis felineus]|uniref:NADPH-dependent FMN reductase-like domain-containing protein n=1 Tax=Opisthorchis felineus TaxID=147828 RepID=A0A4S2MGP3_OPIFE|nr:hypothetical protein CRM22_000063 [Opisthorchis felineus]
MRPGTTALFAASVRPERLNDRILHLVQERLKSRNHVVKVVDPLNIHLPLLQIPWGFYSDPENQAPKELADLVHLVSQADRIIVTTCEYNSAIPPALSNLIDHLPHSALAYKPAGIIAYTTGPVGGQNCASSLRLCLTELGCLVVPHSMILYQADLRVSPEGKTLGSVEQQAELVEEMDLVIQQVEYLDQLKRMQPGLICPKLHPYL